MGSLGREGGAGRRKRKQVIQSPVKHISQYFHNIVFHLSDSKGNKVIVESSSQSTLELSITTLSTKLVNQNKKPFNMSTIVANPMQPEATKIEKLEAKLASFEESSEKEEKLRAKLRYLQFFENFQVATTPAHFVCSKCKEVEVVHKEAPQVKTSYKKEVEVQCLSQETHKKEWQEQEKSRQEVRQEIRREFNKQEQGRGRRTKQEKDKDLVKLS